MLQKHTRENLEFTRNLREIYEKKTSEVDLGVVKDKGGGEQFLNTCLEPIFTHTVFLCREVTTGLLSFLHVILFM